MSYKLFKNLIETSDKYPTETELIYKYSFKRDEVVNIGYYKYQDDDFIKLPLKSEFNKPIIYYNNQNIKSLFTDAQNMIRNSEMNQFSDFSDSKVINEFIFSEIESSLLIEGVRSTRAQIEKLTKVSYDNLNDQNDIIIKNMLLGYEFVKENEITEENIYKLYQILSKKSLKDFETLPEGQYYRKDSVAIVDGAGSIVDRGVNFELLSPLMNELINFINSKKTYEEHLIASHIIHYYLVYLHPYFDYNGRMARVLSFWYNYKNAPSLSLLLVSEAINNKIHKNGYYNAIMNSRRSNNDITYFLEYMGNVVVKYSRVYINFFNIINKLKVNGIIMTRSLELALKSVLALQSINGGYFSWKDYKNFSYDDYSKQYYLRLLNELVDLNILEVSEEKNTNLYKLNFKEWDIY